MIFHCFPNFGVGAFRFIHNPKVASLCQILLSAFRSRPNVGLLGSFAKALNGRSGELETAVIRT
jgi:hypothetical protein